MTFADKLAAWRPLQRNTVSCAAHFIGGFMFVFAICVMFALGMNPELKALVDARVQASGASLS